MTEEEPKVAQPRNSMFDRNIAHAASRGRELEFVKHVPAGDKTIGFVGGLDEGYIQVCNTEDQTLETIDRNNIASWKETSRTLNGLERDEDFDKDQLKRIRDRVEHFAKKMSYSVGQRKKV